MKRKSKDLKKCQTEKSKVSASVRTSQEIWSQRRNEAHIVLNKNCHPPVGNVITEDVFSSIGNEVYYETKTHDTKQTPWLGLIEKAGQIFKTQSEKKAGKNNMSLSLKKINNDARLKKPYRCASKTTMAVLRVLETPRKGEHLQICTKLCSKSRSFLSSSLAKKCKRHSELVRVRFAQVIHNGTLLFNYSPIYSQKLHHKLKLKTSGDVINWNDYAIPQLPCIVCYRRLFNVGGKTIASRSGINLRKNRARLTCDNRSVNFYKDVVLPLKKCSDLVVGKLKEVNLKKSRESRLMKNISKKILSNKIHKIRTFEEVEKKKIDKVFSDLSTDEVVNLLRTKKCKRLNKFTISRNVHLKPLVYNDMQQGRRKSKNKQVITKIAQKSLLSDFRCLRYFVFKIFNTIRTTFLQISFGRSISATESFSNVNNQIKTVKQARKLKLIDNGLLGIFWNKIKYYLNSSCEWMISSSPFGKIISFKTRLLEANYQTECTECQKEFLKTKNAKANKVSLSDEISCTNGISNKQTFHHKSYLNKSLKSHKQHTIRDAAFSTKLSKEFPKTMDQELYCLEKSTDILQCDNIVSSNHVRMQKLSNHEKSVSPVDKCLKRVKKDMSLLNPNSGKSSLKGSESSTESITPLDINCQYKETGLMRKTSVCRQLNKLPFLNENQHQISLPKFDDCAHDRLRKIIDEIQEKIVQRRISNLAVPNRNVSWSSKHLEIKILRSCDTGGRKLNEKILSHVDASVDCHLDHNFGDKSVCQESFFQSHYDKIKKLPSILFQMLC